VSANLFNCSVADIDWWLNIFTGNRSRTQIYPSAAAGRFFFNKNVPALLRDLLCLNEMNDFLTIRWSSLAVFNQGDEGTSWYVILKVSSTPQHHEPVTCYNVNFDVVFQGSVNVVIHGKGTVTTLQDGDDFGQLALINNAPR
jgi:hypothetical protein